MATGEPASPARDRLDRVLAGVEAAHPAWLAGGLVAVALVLRVVVAALLWHGTFSGVVVRGMPFSDARDWDALATEFAEGVRRDPAWAAWGARRPFYYVFLGGVYALTGPSLAVARAVHVALGAVVPGLVFDLLRRLVPLPVALLAALVQALLLADAREGLATMSEPLAAFLAVVALWALVVGLERARRPAVAPAGARGPAGRVAPFLAAGCALALANLARPMTLLAVVALPAAAAWCRGRGDRGRERPAPTGRALAAFVAAAVLTLAPWLVRQWAVHGILTLSDNSAEMLFAATSPRYGTWSPEVMTLSGAGSVKERAAFFSRGVRENLRRHPGWYARNAIGWARTTAERLSPPGWLLAGSIAAGLVWPGRRGPWTSRSAGAALAVVGIVALWPADLRWTLWLVGGALAVWRRAGIVLVLALLGSSVALLGLTATPPYPRFIVSLEWMAAALSAWLVFEAAGAAGRLGSPGPAPARPPAPVPGWGRAGAVVGWLSGALLLLWLGGVGLAAARSLHRVPPVEGPVEGGAAAAWIERVVGDEAGRPYAALRDRLRVYRVTVRDGYAVSVRRDETIRHWSRLFAARPYAFTVFEARGVPEVYATFPGALPAVPAGTPLVLVGVPARLGWEPTFEVIAIARDADPAMPGDPSRPAPGDAAEHAPFLRELAAALDRAGSRP